MKTMLKPSKKQFEPVYHWKDVQDYVQSRHGINLRKYKGHDFWHFLVDTCGIHRGCFFHLPEETPEEWQKEIVNLILLNFPELKTEKMWVDW